MDGVGLGHRLGRSSFVREILGWEARKSWPGTVGIESDRIELTSTLYRPCFKCGGTGETVTFFSFDNDLCRACQGVGRVY